MNRFSLLIRVLIIPLLLTLYGCTDDILTAKLTEFSVKSTPKANSLTLNWDNVTSSNNQRVTYEIHLDEVLIKDSLIVSSYTITGLKPETEYLVKVVAKDVSGNKKEVKNTFSTLVAVLPSDFTITTKDVTNSGFTINWTEATIEGEKGIKYDVSLNEEVVALDSEVLTFTFSDLSPETSYNVKVTAKSIEFETSSIQTTTVTTIIKPAPSIVDISSKDITYNGFTIDWTESRIEGSQGVKYDISLNDQMVTTDLEVLTYTFSSLSSGTTYSVKVTAKSIEFETTSTQNEIVRTLNNSSPSTFTITYRDVNHRGFTIDWTGATVEGTQGVKYSVSLNEELIAPDLDVHTYTFSNLSTVTTYNVIVTAKSMEFETTSTQSITVTTGIKLAPSHFNVSIKGITYNGFTIGWTESTVEGRQGVKYDVSLNDEVVATNLDVLTYTFSSLSAISSYTVKVTAKSVEFETTLSQSTRVTTTIPPSPTHFTVSAKDITFSSFTIDWTESSIGGTQGVKYDVSLNDQVVATDLEVYSYTISNLVGETTYNVKVEAKSIEFGSSLTTMRHVTTAVKIEPSDFSISIHILKNFELNFSWTESIIEGYQGVKYDISLNDEVVVADLEVLYYYFSNLEAGTTYDVKVTAKSVEFETTTSKTVTVETKNGPKPDDFTIYLEDIEARSLKVDWSDLTIQGNGYVDMEVYIRKASSQGYWRDKPFKSISGLEPDTEYDIKMVAKSSEYGTTTEKEQTFKTLALPSTFEVFSATLTKFQSFFGVVYQVNFQVSNVDLLDKVRFNNKDFFNFSGTGEYFKTQIDEDTYEALMNADVKEGIAYHTEGGTPSTLTFTLTVDED